MNNRVALSMDTKLLKARVMILTGQNDEKENILHQTCELGNRTLVEFIIRKAKEVNLLQFIVNAED